MTHLKIQLKNVSEGGSVENVSGAVIAALYSLSKDENLVYDPSDLKGDLLTPGTYLKYANELHAQYPNLNITALSWYLYFKENIIEEYWANSSYGDGTGITTTSAQSVNSWPARANLYFMQQTNQTINGDLKTGKFVFYKEDIKSFDELGLFSNLTWISSGAFCMSSLESIDLSNIVSLRPAVFYKCNLLGVVNAPKLRRFDARDYNVSGFNMEGNQFAGNPMTGIHIGEDVQQGLKLSSVSRDCFRDCIYLVDITGLSEVTELKSYSFNYALLLTHLPDLNPNISIIRDHAFRNDQSFLCIDIRKCSIIEEEAFYNCSSLMALDTNDPSEINNNDTYTLDWSSYPSGQHSMFYGTKLTGKTIILPNLTSIPSNCFKLSNLKQLKAVQATSLGSSAFYLAQSLEYLELGTLTNIGEYALGNCAALTDIKIGNNLNDLTSVENIGLYAFQNSTNLNCIGTDINLPNLKTIGRNAFLGQTKIQTVSNLGLITVLPDTVFHGCSNLTSVTFPSTIIEIRASAFDGTALPKLIYPEGVTKSYFGQTAFPNHVMKYIEVPSTTTDMGNFFHRSLSTSSNDECVLVIKATTPPKLKYYRSASANPEIGHTESGVRKFSAIYVPDSALSDYQNAGGTSDTEAWANANVQSRIKPISSLLTDNPTYWAEYQLRA